MSEVINFKKIKIKTQRAILEDGLLDITMGVYMMLSGLFLKNRVLILNFIWLPLGLALIDGIRRRVVFPRTGYAKLKIPTKEILWIFGITLVGLILAGIAVAIAAPSFYPIDRGWNAVVSYVMTILTTIFFCALAYRFKLSRWYLHGFLFGLAFVLFRSFRDPIVVAILGGIVTIIGLVVFLRFLRKNPTSHQEAQEKIESTNAS